MHKELSRWTKKQTQTYYGYVYKMFGITKIASMKSLVVIQYIIDGIREQTNNIILYGAKDIRKLKKKFATYVNMKENAKTKGKLVEEKSKRTRRDGAIYAETKIT